MQTSPTAQEREDGADSAAQRIVVILNPASGRGQGGRRRAELERLLTQESDRATEKSIWRIVETMPPGNAKELAQEAAASGADIIGAAGGDGTLSEVLNGMIGTGAKLALLPLGTGNDCARTLGLGTDLEAAVRTMLHGEPHAMDVGRAKGRYFLNVAGCGFDAIVADRVNRGFKRLHGTAAYLAAVVQSTLTMRAAQLTLTVDGETHRLRSLLCSVANAKSYGGGMWIAPDAEMDDGLFDLCLVLEAGRIEFLRAFPLIFKGTHIHHPKVRMMRGRRIGVECDPPLPVLIDGEVVGTTPVEFEIVPQAVEMMIPKRGA